jgi:hypothetical protein
MSTSHRVIRLAAGLLALAAAAPASAQIAASPGAPITGLCVYSESSLLGQSQVGTSANQQLLQMLAAVPIRT